MFVGLVTQADGTQTRASSWPQARLQEWSWVWNLLWLWFLRFDICRWFLWHLKSVTLAPTRPRVRSRSTWDKQSQVHQCNVSNQSEEKCHEIPEELVAASFENNRNLVTASFECVQFWLAAKYIVNLCNKKIQNLKKWTLSFSFIETLRSWSRAICPDQLTQIPGNQSWLDQKTRN